jgi:hypothetical protein
VVLGKHFNIIIGDQKVKGREGIKELSKKKKPS